MKLRSYYYGIVHSSFLLLVACSGQEDSFAKEDSRNDQFEDSTDLVDKTRDHWDATGEDDRQAQSDLPHETADPLEKAAGALEEFPVSTAFGGMAPLKSRRRKPAPRAEVKCLVGEMRFEGACVDKKAVDEILEKRHAEAIRKIETATAPEETAKAQGQLIDTQIVQAEKAEDDLDEILEQLKKEDVQL